MTKSFHYSPNLSTSRIRHIANSTQNSYHKTVFMKNSNFLPIYAQIKKIAGSSVASFYLDCDNMEADLQKRYRNLLAKSLSIEDRFRKVQHNLTRYKNQEEMNKTFHLVQEGKEKAIFLQSMKKEANEEEEVHSEFRSVLELEKENNLRAERLKYLSKKLEKERFLLFQSTFTDLTHNFNRTTPYNTFQNYKKGINHYIKDIDYDFDISNNSYKTISYDDEYTSPKAKKLSYQSPSSRSNNYNINSNYEEAAILYKEKQKKIEDLQNKLSSIKIIKKKLKDEQKKVNEAAKNYNSIIEKKKNLLFDSFNESNYQTHIENSKKSRIYSSDKLLKFKIDQIKIRERLIIIRKDDFYKLLNEIELKSKEVIEKEKNVFLLEQQILDVRKKFDDVVLQSQKELDFFDSYSSLKSGYGLSFDSEIKDEFQKILQKNYE